MRCEMPPSPCRSSREPAPIHIPIATDRTEPTRSVTIRSPPSSVVTVYRCTGCILETLCERHAEPAAGIGPPAPDLEARGGELGGQLLAAELGRDLGVHLFTPGEFDLECDPRDAHDLPYARPQPDVDPLL